MQASNSIRHREIAAPSNTDHNAALSHTKHFSQLKSQHQRGTENANRQSLQSVTEGTTSPPPSTREIINSELPHARENWNKAINAAKGNYSYRIETDIGAAQTDYTLTFKDGKLHSAYDNINQRLISDPAELKMLTTAEQSYDDLKALNNDDEYEVGVHKFGENGELFFIASHTAGANHFYGARVTEFKPTETS